MSGPLRLVAGSIFAGDFKVVKPLRTGGQGSLYVVEQVSTSKLRALKLMLPELVAQPTSRKRFELEAKIAARIQSDHVVESIASGVDPVSGTPWLAMELLEGQDLGTYTQKKRHLPPDEVLEIFSQLCHALGEAHKQGIVHRDVKPENIFLATPRRRGVPFMVKVLDFGIARILAESQTISGATTTGLGTPMWMAPEQTVPGGPVAPSTDVWPLGLIAFRLLTGYLFWKAPYDSGASVMMLMAEAFMHPMPTATERAEHYKCKDRLPPGFDEWFARCVSRPMEPRFANAAEAFTALEPLLVAVCEEVPAPATRRSSATFASQDLGIAPKRSRASRADSGPTPPPAEATTGPTGSKDAKEGSAPTGIPAAGRTAPGLQPTGPGRATWEGAPELEAEAVQSSVSGPVTPPEPTPAAPTPPTPPPSARTVDEVPLVEASALPQAGARTRRVVIAATAAGALIGGIFFGMQGGGRGRQAGNPAASAAAITEARPATTPPPVETAQPEAPAGARPEASSEETTASSAESASAAVSSEPVAVGGRRGQKLCKPAGGKCFGNDDCCERTCRKWICRANAALEDPYKADGK